MKIRVKKNLNDPGNVLEFDFSDNQALTTIFAMACRKIGIDMPKDKIVCGKDIDHEWLQQVIDEVDRMWLDDVDDEGSMIMDKEDYPKFKEIKTIIDRIVKDNTKKRTKLVCHSDAIKLAGYNSFIKEFVPSAEKLGVWTSSGRMNEALKKNKLHELIKFLDNAIDTGQLIVYTEV
jgi:uncharacterized protein YaaR (DUF327 family)